MEAQREEQLAGLEEKFVATDVSFEDYLTRFDGVHAEWVMGNVVLMSNNRTHQAIQGTGQASLRTDFLRRSARCIAFLHSDVR